MTQEPEQKTISVTRGRPYTRTLRQRVVTFTCVLCGTVTTELRYPGPLPHYCDYPVCRQLDERIDNEHAAERMRRLRAARKKGAAGPPVCSENV
jgi:hypothetical protein